MEASFAAYLESSTLEGGTVESTSGAVGSIGSSNAARNENGEQLAAVRVDEAPKFDLESYVGNYLGRTKFYRLYLTGICSTYLGVEALKMAVAEAKLGKDVRCYERAVEALARIAPNEPEAIFDAQWADFTRRSVKAETNRLQHELKGYKNNLIKESIRMGNEDLGQHFHRTGDLVSAYKAYARMRDYCTTTSHIASMLFKNINVAVDRGDWLGVQSNIHRLKSLQFKQEDEAKNKAKMWASQGLSQLATGNYLDAATSFVFTDPSLGDNYKEVISPNDVAVYGGLCALASMDRTDLQNNVLENKSFRNFLELEPHIRRAISFFCASKFRLCFDILEAYRVDYMLDLHLQSHLPALYTRIRKKAMQQYLIPYSQASLDAMAKIFSPGTTASKPNPASAAAGGNTVTITDPESPFVIELIKYIQSGTLDARIDLENGLLVANQADMRRELQASVLKNVKEYVDEAHVQLLRINLLHAGLDVPPASHHGRGGGRASDDAGLPHSKLPATEGEMYARRKGILR